MPDTIITPSLRQKRKAISDLSEIHWTNLSVYFLRGIHDHAHIILQGDTGLIREALYLKSIMF